MMTTKKLFQLLPSKTDLNLVPVKVHCHNSFRHTTTLGLVQIPNPFLKSLIMRQYQMQSPISQPVTHDMPQTRVLIYWPY